MGVEMKDEDVRIANLRKGSTILAIGLAVLIVGGIYSVFLFQDIREGTDLMRIVGSVLGALGVILVFTGTRIRHANG